MVVHLCRTAKQGALDALGAALPGPSRPCCLVRLPSVALRRVHNV